MFEVLFSRQPALFIPVLALTGTTLVAIVWILSHYMWVIRRQELDSALKRDMLNRGYAAEEIERVLHSSSEQVDKGNPESLTDKEYALIERMVEAGHSAEEIEGLIRSLKERGRISAVRLPRRSEV